LNADDFRYYRSGVLNCANPNDQMDNNHAVLAIGYGYDWITRTPFFILKNSWGNVWGERGYLRIKEEETGLCCDGLSIA
jgi:C1A family cysteine protease